MVECVLSSEPEFVPVVGIHPLSIYLADEREAVEGEGHPGGVCGALSLCCLHC